MDAVASTKTQGPFDECDGARRVLIFDDRMPEAQALRRCIHLTDPVRSCDCVEDGFALVDAFGQDPTALVLVGYRRGSTAAAQATGLLLGMFPPAWVVGYGTADCAPLLLAAVTSGVRGVMLWSAADPVPARPAVPPRRRRPADDRRSGADLTDREIHILGEIAQGRSNQQIGGSLSMSEEAVKTQARSIYRKLGARDRAHAVALGIRLNYLT